MHKVTILPDGLTVNVNDGEDLLSVQRKAGLVPDAPCGGKGVCGKCLVDVKSDKKSAAFGFETVKACAFFVHEDLTIRQCKENSIRTLVSGFSKLSGLKHDKAEGVGAAFDIGTTTLVGYLLDLKEGKVLSSKGILNPQVKFGADVISRCEYAIANGTDELSSSVVGAMNSIISDLLDKTGRALDDLKLITVVGNTCMHHLFMGIDTKPLTVAPYQAVVTDELEFCAEEKGLVPGSKAIVRVLPNIAGFVGADTVACILSSGFDEMNETALLIDIGTNGEMVLGSKEKMITASTAAGPAFEGAKIECGMRGAEGAIDHVKLVDNRLICHVIGDEEGGVKERNVLAKGICGSGLLDAVSCMLDAGIIDESGRIDETYEASFVHPDTGVLSVKLSEDVYISQKDIREVQLAKGAIAAGIELLAKELETDISAISKVMIAGAFGNYMDPVSAVKIGMIPKALEDRIELIGNAAGQGSIVAALSRSEFLHARDIKNRCRFLELAASPDFQDVFVDNLMF